MVRLHLDTFGYSKGDFAKMLHEKQLPKFYDLTAQPVIPGNAAPDRYDSQRLFQRLAAALRAISFRRLADMLSARALPPMRP